MSDYFLHPLIVDGIHQAEGQEVLLLVLRDDMNRTLTIPIGFCEASAIQIVLDKQISPRPMTHDLTLTLVERLEAPISRVVIDDFSAGTYFARLILNSPEGPISLDCRPSDGVALALRANTPIFASDAVMEGENRDDVYNI